jgi:hypothetical protein
LTSFYIDALPMIHFRLLPQAIVDSAETLQQALLRLSQSHGERCDGHIDLRVDLSLASHALSCDDWMSGQSALDHLVGSGLTLAWKVEDMGQADLFLRLPGEIEPYAGAWSIFEQQLLLTMTPQARSCARAALSL